jgi:hypothetical protein
MRHHPKAHRDRFFAAPAAQNDSSIPRADRRHPEVCQQHHEYDDRNIRPIAHWYGEKCGLEGRGLAQLWAYKHVQGGSGTELYAEMSAVSAHLRIRLLKFRSILKLAA